MQSETIESETHAGLTTMPNEGVFAGIPNAAYHGGPGISKSGLDIIHRSPLHYQHALTAERKSTPAQRIGTAVHDLILEPESFWDRYAIPLDPADFPDAIHSRDALVEMVEVLNLDRLPKLSGSGSKQDLVDRIRDVANSAVGTTAYGAASDLDTMKVGDLKALIAEINLGRHGLLPTRGTQRELAQILADHGQPVELWSDLVEMNRITNDGKEIISAEEFAEISAMRDAVMSHSKAGGLLAPGAGVAEMSCYWRDPETGVLCRCRPDFYRTDGVVVDLKTSVDASPEGFSSSINSWRYHVQAAYYLDGIRAAIAAGASDLAVPKAFVFVAVEKTAPYAVGVYLIDAESIDIGRREYRADLDRYSECVASNSWPGYGDMIQSIGLPEWRLRREEFNNETENTGVYLQ